MWRCGAFQLIDIFYRLISNLWNLKHVSIIYAKGATPFYWIKISCFGRNFLCFYIIYPGFTIYWIRKCRQPIVVCVVYANINAWVAVGSNVWRKNDSVSLNHARRPCNMNLLIAGEAPVFARYLRKSVIEYSFTSYGWQRVHCTMWSVVSSLW